MQIVNIQKERYEFEYTYIQIISKDLHTQVGYAGITIEETLEVKKIMDRNPELCDPKLEEIIRFHSGIAEQILLQNLKDVGN